MKPTKKAKLSLFPFFFFFLPSPLLIYPSFPMGCAVLSRFSHVQLFATLWTVACQAPLSMGFSRQEYWSVLPCPPPGDLPDPGIEPISLVSPALQAGSFPLSYLGSHLLPIVIHKCIHTHTQIHVYTHICSSIAHWFQIFSSRYINRLISSMFFLLNLATSGIAVSMETISFLRGPATAQRGSRHVDEPWTGSSSLSLWMEGTVLFVQINL